MNLFIGRALAFLMGAILLISVVCLTIVRRDPSSAYWLIDNGTNNDPFPNGLYRMMPNGNLRSPILEDFAPRANTSEMYWIEGRAAFLYADCNDGQLTFIRQSAVNGRREAIETAAPISQNCPWEVIPSPNGEKLLVRIFDGGTHALIITEADGSKPIVLTETFNSIVGSETWSPDSKWVYLGGFSPMGGGIHRVTADGKDHERVAVIRFLDSPMWSSDGQLLTFITNGYFHQLDLETNDFRQLTESAEAQYQGAAWVDDAWILTVGADDNRARSLYRMATDGSEQSLLIFGVLNSRYVVTGDGIAMVLAGQTNAQALFGVDVETKRRWSISPTGLWFSNVVLSPDEEWVYFASTLDGGNSLYRARIDGSGMQRLYGLEDDDRAVSLELMPDGEWLVVSYMEDNFPTQRQHRVRISLGDGHVERLPDGSTPLASGLIDLGWNFWLLVAVGGVMIVGAGGLPSAIRFVRRNK